MESSVTTAKADINAATARSIKPAGRAMRLPRTPRATIDPRTRMWWRLSRRPIVDKYSPRVKNRRKLRYAIPISAVQSTIAS